MECPDAFGFRETIVLATVDEELRGLPLADKLGWVEPKKTMSTLLAHIIILLLLRSFNLPRRPSKIMVELVKTSGEHEGERGQDVLTKNSSSVENPLYVVSKTPSWHAKALNPNLYSSSCPLIQLKQMVRHCLWMF